MARLCHGVLNYIETERKGNALFSDTLNTFHLRLYGVGHMVKYDSDSEIGNPLPPHGYSFRLAARVILYDIIIHTTAFGTPVVEHWLERELAQWVHPTKDRSDDPSHHERTLLPRYSEIMRFRFTGELKPSRSAT